MPYNTMELRRYLGVRFVAVDGRIQDFAVYRENCYTHTMEDIASSGDKTSQTLGEAIFPDWVERGLTWRN